jgi:hypothetical protein
MALVKQWLSFYVLGNIHVGLAAYCLTKITLAEFAISNDALANFVFFATILVYNFIRVVQLHNINSMTAIWIRSNKSALILLNSVCLIFIVYYALSFSLSSLLILLPFLLASIFYAVPISSNINGLRRIPGLKLFLISFTWAGVTLYFPLFAENLQGIEGIWISFFQRFLFIMAITIPFDIRDVQLDFPDLRTLPQVIGVGNSKAAAIMAIILFELLEVYRSTVYDATFMVSLVISLVSILLILWAGVRQKRFYSSFWVESIPVFWYVLLLIFYNQSIF